MEVCCLKRRKAPVRKAAPGPEPGRTGVCMLKWLIIALAAFVLYKLVDMVVGLRVAPETEREGLDLAEHGERAYVV